jgi:hypothetical protein
MQIQLRLIRVPGYNIAEVAILHAGWAKDMGVIFLVFKYGFVGSIIGKQRRNVKHCPFERVARSTSDKRLANSRGLNPNS